MESKPPHGIFDLAPSSSLGLTTVLFYGSLIMTLIGLGLGIYFYLKRKNLRKSTSFAPTDPWENLETELRKNVGTASDLQAMFGLNQSLRKGLELKYQEPYTALTSSEIKARLQKKPEFSSDFQAECAEFMKTADKVLFASEKLPDGERARWEARTVEWIQSLRAGRSL